MNLRITDASELVRFLHRVVSESGRSVLSGNTTRVVESHGLLFFLRDDPLELGGPFASLEALIRSEGIRHHVSATESGPPLEVIEWDGWFYRLGAGKVKRFRTVAAAVAFR